MKKNEAASRGALEKEVEQLAAETAALQARPEKTGSATTTRDGGEGFSTKSKCEDDGDQPGTCASEDPQAEGTIVTSRNAGDKD